MRSQREELPSFCLSSLSPPLSSLSLLSPRKIHHPHQRPGTHPHQPSPDRLGPNRPAGADPTEMAVHPRHRADVLDLRANANTCVLVSCASAEIMRKWQRSGSTPQAAAGAPAGASRRVGRTAPWCWHALVESHWAQRARQLVLHPAPLPAELLRLPAPTDPEPTDLGQMRRPPAPAPAPAHHYPAAPLRLPARAQAATRRLPRAVVASLPAGRASARASP